MRHFISLSVVVVVFTSQVAAGTLDFEDLTLGQVYDLDAGTPANPDTFVTGGVTVTLGEFFWLPSGSTTSGSAEVQNGGIAGGAGNEIGINNVNLDFDFGMPLSALSLKFGELGGNVNFNVNGDFFNVEDFQMMPASVGGVAVNVSAGNTPGTMDLTGMINSFAIGGQELWIDDLDFTKVPEPASWLLLATGLLLLSRVRSRRSVV
ncbi:MAG: PEP-CTERM sorting domain-containing protein [Pirellulaceae bacterium]